MARSGRCVAGFMAGSGKDCYPGWSGGGPAVSWLGSEPTKPGLKQPWRDDTHRKKEGSLMKIRHIALSMLLVTTAALHAADAAERPSSKLMQSFAAKGFIAERSQADQAKFMRKMKQLLPSATNSVKGSGGGSAWECVPGAGCWCVGENSPDCDSMFTACDQAGGLWKCSSDIGGNEDVCICT
jgi:hypothetical protein